MGDGGKAKVQRGGEGGLAASACPGAAHSPPAPRALRVRISSVNAPGAPKGRELARRRKVSYVCVYLGVCNGASHLRTQPPPLGTLRLLKFWLFKWVLQGHLAGQRGEHATLHLRAMSSSPTLGMGPTSSFKELFKKL